jgi:outer membrane murein-binding lipoprotein Lpp
MNTLEAKIAVLEKDTAEIKPQIKKAEADGRSEALV